MSFLNQAHRYQRSIIGSLVASKTQSSFGVKTTSSLRIPSTFCHHNKVHDAPTSTSTNASSSQAELSTPIALNWKQHLFAGGLSRGMAVTTMFPIDVVKTRVPLLSLSLSRFRRVYVIPSSHLRGITRRNPSRQTPRRSSIRSNRSGRGAQGTPARDGAGRRYYFHKILLNDTTQYCSEIM